MKASLVLKDIGGFKGKKDFVFESGSLNLVEAPNSGGKSSVIKAILGVLSVPHDGKFDPYLLKEAKMLGVKSDDLNTQEGFVNIHSEKGEVTLNIGDDIETYKVQQNGTYIELPKHSDQRFLLSGILSNDTKILRQLRHTDDNEPDDFNWAVTKLSNAKNYDEIADFIKNEKDAATKKEDEAKNVIKRTKNLREEIDQHRKDLAQITNELSRLEPKFKGKSDFISKRKGITNSIEKSSKDLIQHRANLKQKSDELKVKENELVKINKDIESLEKELEDLELFDLKGKNINQKKLEEIKKKKISDINEQITDLKDIRGEIDGVYNLYYLAQTNLKDRDFTKCPLCNEGNLTFDKIEIKLKELKQKKDSISNEIMKKSQDIKLIDTQISDIIKNKGNLERKISDKKEEKKFTSDLIENQLRSAINQFNETITGLSSKLEKEQKELQELIKIIGSDDEELNKVYTEKEKQKGILSDKITIKQNDIDSAKIEFKQNSLTPDFAIQILSKYNDALTEIIGFAKEMADKQRQAAADKFNNTIKVLMNELNFEEFRDVKLNKEFRLYIERFDPKTDGYVPQLVSTLSTSEKLTIALILQIALKETYIPQIPFLILDDVMEDFDENRRNKIYNYLSNKAKEENWIIILTKLVEEKKPIHVVNWSPP
jgi:DNA repair exonuclease SbcCD ATPase subunit